LNNGFYGEPGPNGTQRIHLAKNGRSVGHFDAPPDKLGLVAAMFLGYAHQAALRKGPSTQWTAELLPGATIPATRVSMNQHPDPQSAILAIQVGETQIGFELPRSVVGALGQALYAASASTQKKAN
jgi:hypothetical protein